MWGARPWRDHDGGGPKRPDLLDRHGVVAPHLDLGAELTEVLHEVVRERIVIVDDEYHVGRMPSAMSHQPPADCHAVVMRGSGTRVILFVDRSKILAVDVRVDLGCRD